MCEPSMSSSAKSSPELDEDDDEAWTSISSSVALEASECCVSNIATSIESVAVADEENGCVEA